MRALRKLRELFMKMGGDFMEYTKDISSSSTPETPLKLLIEFYICS